MAYQSFPWQEGDSKSFEKLKALQLPKLVGKKVLDIGCNTGFFCGYSEFCKAKYVLGIDKNESFIGEAKKLFPNSTFECKDWSELDDTKYDIILFLSAIHYAQDQEQSINFLMDHLENNGKLILEIGIAPGIENDFATVIRNVGDKRLFPTFTKMHNILSKFSYTYIGPSINQSGDPIPRHVYHIMHRNEDQNFNINKEKQFSLFLMKKFIELNKSKFTSNK